MPEWRWQLIWDSSHRWVALVGGHGQHTSFKVFLTVFRPEDSGPLVPADQKQDPHFRKKGIATYNRYIIIITITYNSWWHSCGNPLAFPSGSASVVTRTHYPQLLNSECSKFSKGRNRIQLYPATIYHNFILSCPQASQSLLKVNQVSLLGPFCRLGTPRRAAPLRPSARRRCRINSIPKDTRDQGCHCLWRELGVCLWGIIGGGRHMASGRCKGRCHINKSPASPPSSAPTRVMAAATVVALTPSALLLLAASSSASSTAWWYRSRSSRCWCISTSARALPQPSCKHTPHTQGRDRDGQYHRGSAKFGTW